MKNYTTVDIWDLFSIITVTLLFSVVGVLPHQQPSGLALTASNTTFHFGQTTISDIVLVPSQSLFGPVTLPRARCCCCCCCWWRRTAGSNQLCLAECRQRNHCDTMTFSLSDVSLPLLLERSHVSSARLHLVFTPANLSSYFSSSSFMLSVVLFQRSLICPLSEDAYGTAVEW